MPHTPPARLLLVLSLVATAVLAQNAPVVGYHVGTSLGWSAITNATSAPIVSSAIVVTEQNSPWMKLWFAGTDLGSASRIRITGAQDEAVQELDAAALADWSSTSAYFNGPTVIVELIVAPNDTASAVIAGFDAGLLGVVSIDTICGPTDDRVPSTERRVGRLLNGSMNALCSGGLISTNSCYLTAGHCVSSGTVFTVEFNCPPSTAGGSIVHPGPQDQYPVNYSTLASLNGGVGNDWCIARLNNNTTTGLPASLVQGHYALATSLPPVQSVTRITGFGSASGVLNLANKTHTGPLVTSGGTGGTTVQYQVDTTGGNSGSSVVRESNQTVFGIHTHGGCTSSGGQNSGTAITHPGPQAHYALICTPNPPSFAISLTQAGLGAPINITVTGAPASSELFNIVSLTPAVPTNSGPTAGLNIGTAELLSQINLPLGAEPFHVMASPGSGYAFTLPTSGMPGTPISVDIASVAFTPGAGFAGYLGRAAAVNATVQP
jgi:V8-like Glu-specific endopeptidase